MENEEKMNQQKILLCGYLIVNFNTMPSENHMDKHFVKLVHGCLQEHLTESNYILDLYSLSCNYSDCLFEPETVKRISRGIEF